VFVYNMVVLGVYKSLQQLIANTVVYMYSGPSGLVDRAH
jgi:hypothetical protein